LSEDFLRTGASNLCPPRVLWTQIQRQSLARNNKAPIAIASWCWSGWLLRKTTSGCLGSMHLTCPQTWHLCT